MRLLLLHIGLFIGFNCVYAQQVKSWVVFKDKQNENFDPYVYFSEKNIQRKITQGLPLYDKYDLPVSTSYVEELRPLCDSITYVSRWLNAACVYTKKELLEKIAALPFVRETEIISRELMICEAKEELSELHQGEINLLKGQIARMKGNAFRQNNLTGKGVTIAIIDAGFNGYLANQTLSQLRINGQIKYTYDFIRKNSNVDCGSSHGTSVFSCIAGRIDSIYMGCAYDADFLLYRTEKAFNEKFNEEEYWMAAMESADQKGADVINTSLGYSDRRYFEKDMDGKKSLLSCAANIASGKGMLVVCSAGNEGDLDWKVICTPADADSALSVGALNPWTGVQAAWSSFGPSADKRLKPNVTAFGYVMAAKSSKGIEETLGTSFSSPLVAGFAACLRQRFPEISAHELLRRIEKSGDLYPYYDYAHGYGVPQADKALELRTENSTASFAISYTDDSMKVTLVEGFYHPSFIPITNYHFTDKDFPDRFLELNDEKYERSTHFDDERYNNTSISSLFTHEPGYFYYNIQNKDEQVLAEYAVLNVRTRFIFRVKKSEVPKKYTFHYKGFTQTVEF